MSLLFFSFFIQRYIFLPICDLLRS
jgi:hypothetical protein